MQLVEVLVFRTLAMSLDRSAASTLDDASEEQAPRHAMSARESHPRFGDPDATAPAVALHRKKSEQKRTALRTLAK